jgi:hypothetical protein
MILKQRGIVYVGVLGFLLVAMPVWFGVVVITCVAGMFAGLLGVTTKR